MPLPDLPFKATQLRVMATYVFECILSRIYLPVLKEGFE